MFVLCFVGNKFVVFIIVVLVLNGNCLKNIIFLNDFYYGIFWMLLEVFGNVYIFCYRNIKYWWLEEKFDVSSSFIFIDSLLLYF